MTWNFEKYQIASPQGIKDIEGYVYKGIGVNMTLGPSPKGKRPPIWNITHIGSGHRIALLKTPYQRAILIAEELAECADWSFGGLDGWKNMDPSIKSKVEAIEEKYRKDWYRPKGYTVQKSHEQARQIMMNRCN